MNNKKNKIKINKLEIHLLHTYPVYKKLYAMQNKIEAMEEHDYDDDQISRLIDEFFEHGMILNSVVKVGHPAELAVRESMKENSMNHDIFDLGSFELNDKHESTSENHSVNEDFMFRSNHRNQSNHFNPQNHMNQRDQATINEILNMEIPSNPFSDPYVINVCNSFSVPISSADDLANAVLDCLDE